jgi:hypothetical protein
MGQQRRTATRERAHFFLRTGTDFTDLSDGKRPNAMKPDEAAVYDFCMELSTTHAVKLGYGRD